MSSSSAPLNSPNVPLRPAATILLLRDRPGPVGGVEVFMERRHLQSGFVGGAYVFPGGRVDSGDAIDPARCAGLDEAAANRQLSMDSGGLAHFVAVVRECFEEAGVLLAYDGSGVLLDFSDHLVDHHYQVLRKQLNDGSLSLPHLIKRERLTLATDQIAYWSHWITPIGEPKRYDTRFFIALAPPGQRAHHDDWELTHSAWVTPGQAIEKAIQREWMIIFPTLMNLKMLATHRTAREAIAWARAQPTPLPANLPKVFDGGIVLPGDRGYEAGTSDISTVDREAFEKRFLP